MEESLPSVVELMLDIAFARSSTENAGDDCVAGGGGDSAAALALVAV